jgi:hypothetical protein
MLAKVTVHAADIEASRRFYDTVLPTITAGGWSDFALAPAAGPDGVTRRLHIGFVAPSIAHVDRFWWAGTEAGYRDDGPPGPRPEYGPDYYGGFLLDPDGNSAEAVHHDSLADGVVDHLWIRVADLVASRRFYEEVTAHTGFRIVRDTPERVRFASSSGSFSVLEASEPAANVGLELPADVDRDATDPDGNAVALIRATG